MSILSCPVGPTGEVTPITVMCKLQKARHEWAKALAYDGVEDNDMVVFSEGNPFIKRYDELIAEYHQLLERLKSVRS